MTRKPLTMLAAVLMLALPVAADDESHVFGAPQTVRLSVSFDGGSVAEYIKALRQAHAEANIVEMGDVSIFKMPAVDLKKVTLGQALSVLDNMRTMRGMKRHELAVESHGGRFPVYTIHTQTRHVDSPSGGSLVSHVWSVGNILESDQIKQDDLLSAVESAVNLSPDQAAATTINYHPETKLLMARAPRDNIDAIENVLDELWGSGPAQQEELDKLKRDNQRLRRELQTLEDARKNWEIELQMLQRDKAEYQAQLGALESQYENMQEMMQQHKQEAMELREQVRHLKMELARQREKATKSPNEEQ